MLLPPLPFFFPVVAMLHELLAVVYQIARAVGRSMRFTLIQAEMAYKYKRTGKADLMNLVYKQQLKQISEITGAESDKNYVIFGGLRLSMDSRSCIGSSSGGKVCLRLDILSSGWWGRKGTMSCFAEWHCLAS